MFLTPASLGGITVGLFGPIIVARYLQWMPQQRNLLFGLMVFSTCHIKKPFYQEVFFVLYRGVDRGFGVTIPDVMFIGFFLFILIGGYKRRIIIWPNNSFPWVQEENHYMAQQQFPVGIGHFHLDVLSARQSGCVLRSVYSS